MSHFSINGNGESATGMKLRYDIYRFKPVFLGRFPLQDDRAVEMLTALDGEKNPLLKQHRCDAVIQSCGNIQTGVGADTPSSYFAGGTAHYKQIAQGELRHTEQFRHGQMRLLPDNFFECGHFLSLPFPQTAEVLTAGPE